MTSVTTNWMSIKVPDGFTGSVERAEIVLESVSAGGKIRVLALRKDAPYSITMGDAKKHAVGGDKENPRHCDEKTFSNQPGYFFSRPDERHAFSTVIADTLTLLSSDGFNRAEAEAAIEAIMAGLTINSENG